MKKKAKKKAAKRPKNKREAAARNASSGSAGPPLNLPSGEDEALEPSQLLLDSANLRLLETSDEALQKTPTRLIGQQSIQRRITSLISQTSNFNLNEIVKSIKTNGFLKHERLIVARFDAKHYLVLEGNRRLTAVRTIYKELGNKLTGLPEPVRESLRSLPCYVLDGVPVDGSDERLDTYRRAAEIYIGMRHLMQILPWEPASRYEFQARLINQEGWSPEDVADRFGRQKYEVLRDLKAQTLYRYFRDYESRKGIRHKLVYNAFAEAARSRDIMNWCEWSEKDLEIGDVEAAEVFFDYLTARVKDAGPPDELDENDETPRETAKQAVKHFKEMLNIDDTDVVDALRDRNFREAEVLFDDRKEGALPRRLSQYLRALKRVTLTELTQSPDQTFGLLRDISMQVESMLETLEDRLARMKQKKNQKKR